MWPFGRKRAAAENIEIEADIRTGRVLARLDSVTQRFETIANRVEARLVQDDRSADDDARS